MKVDVHIYEFSKKKPEEKLFIILSFESASRFVSDVSYGGTDYCYPFFLDY